MVLILLEALGADPVSLDALQARTGVLQWVGTVSTGVCATGAEYSGEPALAVMLVDLPVDSFRLFIGDDLPAGAGFGQRAGDMQAFTALVHASAIPVGILVILAQNQLITIEAALSGGLIFRGRDGCFRDLASIHGTYRKVEETLPALNLIGSFLAEMLILGGMGRLTGAVLGAFMFALLQLFFQWDAVFGEFAKHTGAVSSRA